MGSVLLVLAEGASTTTTSSGNGAVDLTGIIGLVLAVVTGVVVPIYMYRRNQQKIKEQEDKFKAILDKQEAEKEGANSVTSWDNLAKRLERERDRLAEQLEEADARFARRLAIVEEKFRRERESDRQRISELEAEVAALQRVIQEQAKQISGAP